MDNPTGCLASACQQVYKLVLAAISKRIFPILSNPAILADFLTDSYNLGGASALLALHGLFVLMTEHNLVGSACRSDLEQYMNARVVLCS